MVNMKNEDENVVEEDIPSLLVLEESKVGKNYLISLQGELSF